MLLFSRNMVKMSVKKCEFVRKRQKYPTKVTNFPSKSQRFPSKSKISQEWDSQIPFCPCMQNTDINFGKIPTHSLPIPDQRWQASCWVSEESSAYCQAVHGSYSTGTTVCGNLQPICLLLWERQWPGKKYWCFFCCGLDTYKYEPVLDLNHQPFKITICVQIWW